MSYARAARARIAGSRALRWALEGALVLALVLGVAAWQARHHRRGDAPRFVLRALDGALVTNDALQGKPTLVVFWAPWCGVCRFESANVSRVQALVGERARVVSIASEYEGVDSVRAWVARHEVDYPVLLGGSKAARDFGVEAFPTAFFLDAQGRIEGSVVGYTTTLGLLTRLLL